MTTVNDFINFSTAYDSYIDAAAGAGTTDTRNKKTMDVLTVSIKYNFDGKVNDVLPDTQDKAYYLSALTGNWTDIGIPNSTLLRIAGTAYHEASHVASLIQAMPFAVYNRFRKQKASLNACYGTGWEIRHALVRMRNNWNDAQYMKKTKYKNTPGLYENFMTASISAREGTGNTDMVLAIQYTMRAAIRDLNLQHGAAPGYNDEAKGGIGWHGNDFGYKNPRTGKYMAAYHQYYEVGFHFNNSSDNLWGLIGNQPDGSYSNLHNMGDSVIKWARLGNLSDADKSAVRTAFYNVAYWWESELAGGTGSHRSIIYKPTDDFVPNWDSEQILGHTKFTNGVKEYGGVASPLPKDKKTHKYLIKEP